MAGSLIGWALSGGRHFVNPLAITDGSLALALGQRTGRLQTLNELHKPISLFPDGVPGPR